MPFHAFWVIYTIKELDSHAKQGQSKKKKKKYDLDIWQSISVLNRLLPGSYTFLIIFVLLLNCMSTHSIQLQQQYMQNILNARGDINNIIGID